MNPGADTNKSIQIFVNMVNEEPNSRVEVSRKQYGSFDKAQSVNLVTNNEETDQNLGFKNTQNSMVTETDPTDCASTPFKSKEIKTVATHNKSGLRKCISKQAPTTYRRYSDKQICDFINMVIEQLPIKYAADKCGITRSTAYRLCKIYYENDMSIPVDKPRGPKKFAMFDESHRQFLTLLTSSHPQCTLQEMRERLLQQFPNISVSKSAVYRFVRNECGLRKSNKGYRKSRAKRS